MHAIAIEATATIRFSSVWLIFVAIFASGKDTDAMCDQEYRQKQEDFVYFPAAAIR